MKSSLGYLLVVTCATLLSGCVPLRYSEFRGSGNEWPTAEGAMADGRYAIPVYRGWPEKSYRVVGSLRHQDPNVRWTDVDISAAAREARSRGADAVIIRRGSELGVEKITGASEDSRLWARDQETALIIKWRPDTELAQERAATERFLNDFTSKPGRVVNREVAPYLIGYLDSLGLKLESREASQESDRVLSALSSKTHWLYKGTLRTSAITSSQTTTVYGLAKMTQNDKALTIVSQPGAKAEVNFSGTVEGGRVAGQLGLTSWLAIVSAKAEGAMIDQRLSLTAQGHTADGAFQGSFTFIQ